tara:strand:+ start:422 stop:844 length:423 start_codon:yes stop_codon:yes gene_type:complete
MDYENNNKTIDFLIIGLIFFIFICVLFIFYSEITKNNKIKISKNNFFEIKNLIIKETDKCKKNKKNYFFGISCKNQITKEEIYNHINKNKNFINAYNGENGIDDSIGSVNVNILDNSIILTIDFDANGGNDIRQTINILN